MKNKTLAFGPGFAHMESAAKLKKEKTMKKQKESKKEFTGLMYDTLQNLINRLTVAGITDFSKIEFEPDESHCFYESDQPGIMAVVKD